jgi:hypothetical protein
MCRGKMATGWVATGGGLKLAWWSAISQSRQGKSGTLLYTLSFKEIQLPLLDFRYVAAKAKRTARIVKIQIKQERIRLAEVEVLRWW